MYLGIQYLDFSIVEHVSIVIGLFLVLSISNYLLKEYYYIKQIIIYICLIGIILTISDYYEDNYSIEKLANLFELGEFGTIDYKILLSENKGIKKCKINGDYKWNRKNHIEYELDNNDLCDRKFKNSNLDHLGEKKN
tara:strand:+ start:92 stop:502 length:411 start_codon:yes stop_codon:yes gene_type:complete